VGLSAALPALAALAVVGWTGGTGWIGVDTALAVSAAVGSAAWAWHGSRWRLEFGAAGWLLGGQAVRVSLALSLPGLTLLRARPVSARRMDRGRWLALGPALGAEERRCIHALHLRLHAGGAP
jgi:hypothetical protein